MFSTNETSLIETVTVMSFHLTLHIHSIPVRPLSGSHFTYTTVHMEDGTARTGHSLETLWDLLSCCSALFMWWQSPVTRNQSLEDQVGGRQQLAAPPSRLPAAVLTEECHTQSMRSVDSWGQGPVLVGSALPNRPGGERNGSVSRPGPLERWKDNPPPTPLPPCCRWTSCSVKPFVSSDRARLGRKDMSGKLQNLLMFLRTWKDLYNTFRFDGLSHVRSGQPFLLTCSNNESLMCGIPFSPPAPESCF